MRDGCSDSVRTDRPGQSILLLLDAVVMLAWQERRALPGLDPSLLTNMRGWAVRLRDEARARIR